MPRIPRMYIGLVGLIVGLLLIQQQRSSVPSSFSSSSSSSSFSRRPGRDKGRDDDWSIDEYLDEEISIDSKGMMTWTHGLSKHPIELLIERGKRKAAAMKAKIAKITSVAEAADDYERAFGMKPPRGFDAWYEFTQSCDSPHPPPVPSLIPLAHKPFVSFLSLPLDILHERVAEVRDKGAIFTFTFVPDGQGDKGTACTNDQEWKPEDWETRGKGRVKIHGDTAWLWRCNNTLTFLLPMLPLLPDELFHMDPPLELAFSSDDGPRGMVHNTFREKSEALGKANKIWSKAQLEQAEQAMRWTYGWAWSCPDNTPLKNKATDLVLNDLTGSASSSALDSEKTFIADSERSVDFCSNPDLMGLHHMLLSDPHRAAVEMVPVVATCKTMWNSDVVGVPLDEVWREVDYVPWEQKESLKAFWRGSSTGLPHKKTTPWRSSQRERLHFFANNASDEMEMVSVLLPDQTIGEYTKKELNARYVDAGLAGGPLQCDLEDGSCDDMAREIEFKETVRKEDALNFKFVLDVDGNGWSSRFRRLLFGNNVVMKSTIFPEWFSEMLIPWYHYVPIKLDYSDIYDIMAFFTGPPESTNDERGHDTLAEEIAEHGGEFCEEKWRVEDMQSFTFLMILEYWRLMSPDRAAASYNV